MDALLDDWHDLGSTLDLQLLRPLLRVIDEGIAEVNSRCDRDPSSGDTFGWYDDAEALAGLGFVACQQFLNKVYRADEAAKGKNAGKSLKKIRKARTEIRWGALGKGAKHACGVTYAQAVDAAANFWKHHGE
jgi:hypothetical protein